MNEFNYDDSAYLAHHGIKGMKWGVRKSRDEYRSSRTSGAIRNRLAKTSSNFKSFAKSKRGRRALAVAAGAGATAGAITGAALVGSKIARNRNNNRNGYGSYQEIDNGYDGYRLPYNNYDQYNPYKQHERNRYGHGRNLPAVR